MKKTLQQTIKISLFFATGILLFWLVYRDQNINQIMDSLRSANYWWIFVSLVLGLLSHLSRAMRWNILIESMGYQPKLRNTFFAIMVMYLANMAIPRAGEITRCGIVSKYEKVPFSKLLGTVVVDRVFDVIMLGILLLVVIFTQYDILFVFLDNHPGIAEKVNGLLPYTQWFMGLMVLGLVALFAVWKFRHRLSGIALFDKLSGVIVNFWEGVKTVIGMKRKWAFIFHSIFIWVMYFMMIYATFYAFPYTSHLGVMAGLTIFVMSSFGMVVPVPGGIGAWHFMVIETLLLYGVASDPYGYAFAFAAHGAMTLFLIVMGVISLVALPIVNKVNENEAES